MFPCPESMVNVFVKLVSRVVSASLLNRRSVRKILVATDRLALSSTIRATGSVSVQRTLPVPSANTSRRQRAKDVVRQITANVL